MPPFLGREWRKKPGQSGSPKCGILIYMNIPSPKTVLVVEDDVSLRSALGEKLRHEGFVAVLAENGLAGLEAIKKQKPDLILLDLLMPIMDGMAMLQKVRMLPGGTEIPVIVLSNLSDPMKIEEGIESGVSEYLVKSDWKIDDVMTKIKERLV